MSITALRATFLAAGAAALAVAAGPAAAQADRDTALNVLVECSKIGDPTARLACYDNNIKSAAGSVRSAAPGQARAQGAPLTSAEVPSGFGGESVRTEQRFRTPAGQAQSIRPKVTAVVQREPGIYLVTIEDGAQWVFTDGVGLTYRPPRVNSIVEIDRGALGSFLMRVDGQEPIRVRRVR